MDKIIDLARREIERLSDLKRSNIIANAIVFPAFFSIWIALFDKINSVSAFLFWIVFGAVILLQCLIFYFNISSPQLVQEVYFEARDLFEENETKTNNIAELENQIKYLLYLEASVRGWRAMQREFVETTVADYEEFKEAVSDIMAPIIQRREELFDFNSGALWNFALYMYNSSSDKLVPVWREKDDRHPSEGKGRDWGRGQGHVGKCFVDNESKITPDATLPEVRAHMKAPEEMRTGYDENVYKSFAAIPVGPVKKGASPIGVLVATSDHVNQFDWSNCLILRHAAAVLANFVYVNRLGDDKILPANRGQPSIG